jgi:hypothetical protein
MQIRVSAREKAAIRSAAKRAGVDMSAYVLSHVLSVPVREFRVRIEACRGSAAPAFALAELNSLLSRLTPVELSNAIAAAPSVTLTPFLANYIAAMIEAACEKSGIPVPGWTRAIEPLLEAAFGSALQSLRLHLLTHSPAPFRRRNIFIDSSLGDQV